MRFRFLLLFCFICQFCSAQKISYNIPEGYEKSITREDYKKMVDIAVPLVSSRFAVEEVKDGTIVLKDGQIFNLHNLIMRCAALKNKADWEAEVKGHFKNMFASFDAQAKINPDDYETIKDMLALRIYSNSMIASYGGAEQILSKIDLEGTHTLLMLDLPGAFTPIQKELFRKWKKDSAEVFRMAQANTNKQQVEKMTQEFKPDSNKYLFNFILEDNYAASYILDLKNNTPEFVGEWGSVVVIPHKGMAGICKIGKDNPVDFVKFIQLIDPLIQKQYRQHEQPILPDYFWYYNGKFTKISVLKEKEKINVIAPLGLAELMTSKK